jgi:hypothetical protein
MNTTDDAKTAMKNDRILSGLVAREVHLCVSGVVNYAAKYPETLHPDDQDELWRVVERNDYDTAAQEWIEGATAEELREACEALELDPPGDGWDEASRDEAAHEIGATFADEGNLGQAAERALCDLLDIEPHRMEALEFWAVSTWFAEELAKEGEATGEVLGLTVWGRTCSGQSIASDWVIERIARRMGILAGQQYEWSL